MSKINLLPWREERRAERKKQFLASLGLTALLGLCSIGGVHAYFDRLISNQQQRNAYLENEIAALDEEIAEIKELEKERASLISRMRAIETLQTSRPLVVHLLDELVTSLPDGIYLNEIEQKGKKLTIQGTAESNARVSNLMRNLEASEWLTNATLEIIESDDDKNKEQTYFNKFILHVNQIPIKTDDEEEEAES